MAPGTITGHALMNLEARGVLFVQPGVEVISLINNTIQNLIDTCLD